MAMTEWNKDFRYIRDTYTARAASPRGHRTIPKPKRDDLRGKTCPSCGLTRSMMNLCDCNS